MTSQDDFNALVEPTKFAQVGKVHVDMCQGDGASAHVLAWLVFVTFRGEHWYPVSGEVVGEELGYSAKQAKRILHKLRDLGLVVSRRIDRWNPALEYTLSGGAAEGTPPAVPDGTPPEVPDGTAHADPKGTAHDVPKGTAHPITNKRTEEEHTRGGGDGSPPALILVPEPEGDPFDDWWAAYPRKTGKAAARKAYRKAVARGVVPSLLSSALVWQAVKGQALNPDSGAQYIPHPATWLNQERYADEPPSRAEAYAAMSAGDQGRLLMDLYDEAERQKGDTLTPGERQQIKQQLGGTG